MKDYPWRPKNFKDSAEYSWEHIIPQSFGRKHQWLTPFINSKVNSGYRIPSSVNSAMGDAGWRRRWHYTKFGAGVTGAGYGSYKLTDYLLDDDEGESEDE